MLLVQFALYLAQPDYHNGINLGHTAKGIIFFFWAWSKNLSPLISSTYIERLGNGKVASIGASIGAIGYALLVPFTNIYGIVLAAILMGLGIGAFQHSLQTEISQLQPSLAKDSRVWAGYKFSVNIAVFIGGLLSAYLIELSPYYVFIGASVSAFLVALVSPYIFSSTPGKADIAGAENRNHELKISDYLNLIISDKSFAKKLLAVTLFAVIYMQFYETLPNFIADFADKASLKKILEPVRLYLGQPASELGFRMEYLFNFNALLTLLIIVPLAYLSRKINPQKVFAIGMILVSLSLLAFSYSLLATIVIAVFFFYTIGESLVNPSILQYITNHDPKGDQKNTSTNKALYIGCLFIAWGVGLGFGGLIGGASYEWFLSSKYTYQPWLYWLPYTLLGILSIIIIYSSTRESRGRY
ncbi:MAG: hypothetical protein Kapaf2KO_06790 [Candidatus Kapaibacteriales bacterium]